ncbi:lipoyl(octanoyl) transferase LipB [Candidatus Nitronereus thalassa]|uniref:Octanoyltransferase n=1 Tax=Candidatus Nitronereus thalassa TaxID=3020898 RepID=A0ABU3KA33_9BACT|nr:lipoyl(octanoyl) transferase LipB [Candidatus Nitronereus thalassa]MDT7043251.1 lipoyl(octanoyl) transferase LipB [Candidatus Nitronereus thalassa]
MSKIPHFSQKTTGQLFSIPRLDYAVTRQFQWHICQERTANRRSDTMVLVEHEPIFTLGRTAKDEHFRTKLDSAQTHGIQTTKSERGGSVTYHGPGQIVGYPILKLRDYCSGPKTYMRMLEEVLIRVLAEWGIIGQRVEKFVGVWVADPKNSNGSLAKIAAMGVKITHGVTMHGFALNATVNLEPFQYIVPCGIENCQVTSMAEVLGRDPGIEKVRDQIANHFAEVFGIEWTEKITEIPFLLTDSSSRSG